ncbi:preprotein translocase subunit YajC [Perlucidibaca aquatica]|jgi:preprotein translocase subunit YajC|uniref:preprotein translocase subunit YajC n=1 Tax=Perlucidibaca aquatica TaxID=1852776 RepID=UPI00083A8FD7|nr:preprotein translocase subunit YajC [Perlucidibaca aquatica]
MSFLISDAMAEGGAAVAGQPSMTGQLVMLVGFVVIFYFLLWRPQAKRQKEARALIDNLQKGDEVVFAGGLLGRIVKLEGDFAVIALNDSLEVKVQKASVVASLPKGTLKSL